MLVNAAFDDYDSREIIPETKVKKPSLCIPSTQFVWNRIGIAPLLYLLWPDVISIHDSTNSIKVFCISLKNCWV